MPVYDENDKGMNNLDGLPNFSPETGYKPPPRTKVKKPGMKDKLSGSLKKVPIFSIVIILLILLVGIMTLSVAARVSSLSAEIADVRAVKMELGNLQSSTETKLAALTHERDRMKTELSQLKAELDAMRSQQKHQAEAAAQKLAAAQKQAAAAKQKTVATKKPNPKEKRP